MTCVATAVRNSCSSSTLGNDWPPLASDGNSSRGGIRTRTGVTPQGILSHEENLKNPCKNSTFSDVGSNLGSSNSELDAHPVTAAISPPPDQRNTENDQALATLIDLWPRLPEAVKQTIAALVQAVAK